MGRESIVDMRRGDGLGLAWTDRMHLQIVRGRDLGHPVSKKSVRGHQNLVPAAQHAGDAHLDTRHARSEDQMHLAVRLEHLTHA